MSVETLYPTELRIFRILGKGFIEPGEICAKLKIARPTLNTHLCNIRKKTGLRDLTNSLLIRRMLERASVSLEENIPVDEQISPAQKAILELRIAGYSFTQIAMKRHIALSTALNLGTQGCLRLGIFAKGKTRLRLLRDALGKLDSPMNDPMF